MIGLLSCETAASAQQPHQPESGQTDDTGSVAVMPFLAGAVTALVAHEAGHLALGYAFGADPAFRRVEFGGLPFFAITHDPVSRRREAVISSAGFWVQQAISEAILTTRPRLREERASFAKGVLAFNVLASLAYGGVALAHAGPAERDTRGIANSIGPEGIDERWVGVLVLAPALLDTWRYFTPEQRWVRWASRAAKAGMVLIVLK